MKLAIMQPYFFPYIGYFQLMNAVDEFVVYDNIEYSKKGWINRNRILVENKAAVISLPLKKDSDYLSINERYTSEEWSGYRKKMLNKIQAAYQKAPHFETAYPMVETALLMDENNLFKFILHSLRLTREFLDISTELVISSSVPVNHKLKGEEKVVEICKARNASSYINAIGGLELYNRERFGNENIDLHFLKTNDFCYRQFNDDFVPGLSIIDVIMFNTKGEINNALNQYKLQ